MPKENDRSSLCLRPITMEDTDFMVRLVSDPMVTRYLPGMITNRKMMESWIIGLGTSDHEYIALVDNRPIGECSLTDNSDGAAEIGFMLLPEYWRQGHGIEAVRQLLTIAVKLPINEVVATTDAENIAAIRLLENTGFKRQRVGWMLSLSEEGDSLPDGQHIIEFKRKVLASLH